MQNDQAVLPRFRLPACLLARASQRLFARFPGTWDTPERASVGEQRALELHRAVAALYRSDGVKI